MAASALIGCVSFLLLAWRLPGGLIGAPVDLKTWTDVGRNRMIVLLLLITTLQMSGQFVVLTFMGPLLTKLTGAGPDAIGLVFACYGVCGFIGIAIATRIVDSWGRLEDIGAVDALMLAGLTGWAVGAGIYPLMVVLRRDLGAWLCLHQFNAAGAVGRRRTGAGVRLGVAQHLGALCRAGRRFGDRRRALRARSAARRRVMWRRLCCAGADPGDPS